MGNCHALHSQAGFASEPRNKKMPGMPQRWCSSNAIVALVAAIVAAVSAAEIMRG
jgi:hypothetical protein